VLDVTLQPPDAPWKISRELFDRIRDSRLHVIR
jgi:hypothetical protein